MRVVQDKVFNAVTIDLDETTYVRCSFNGCIFRYSGRKSGIYDCKSTPDCKWEFHGAASRTVSLLTTMGMLRPEYEFKDLPDTIH